ncbi:protein PALS1-like isoform X2 [Ornithodoros turicata]|uniref:protein PALS1-like isoform X2 n=1 Tax=Ornithodoros turicata TaxID=34597 RepID=UPI003139CEB4
MPPSHLFPPNNRQCHPAFVDTRARTSVARPPSDGRLRLRSAKRHRRWCRWERRRRVAPPTPSVASRRSSSTLATTAGSIAAVSIPAGRAPCRPAPADFACGGPRPAHTTAMVDLGGYVIILVETTERKIRLYGSPADRADLEVGDEILEVNGRSLEDCTHGEVISHIHQCIRSRTICLRVRRRARLALDLAQSSSHVQEAFVIAVEQQARERLERLSALKRIKPVDMTKLSQELNAAGLPATSPTPQPTLSSSSSLRSDNNGLVLVGSEASPIYVTSVPQLHRLQHRRMPSGHSEGAPEAHPPACLQTSLESSEPDQELELKQEISDDDPMIASPPVPTPRKSLHSPSSPEESTMSGPHREMAVDVPDSFVGVAKTAPRYPPPRPSVPPPKPSGSSRSSPAREPPLTNGRVNGVVPTDEQLDRIRKYQDELRQRREEGERQAQEEEFLRSSLRGSKKLRALEQNPPELPVVGVDNTAFEIDDTTVAAEPQRQSPPTRLYRSEELLESLSKLEKEATRVPAPEMAAVAALLCDPGFHKSLAVSNKVQEIWCYNRPPTPACQHSHQVAQEVMGLLQDCTSPEATQLLDILSQLEMDCLLQSHDAIASRCHVAADTATSPLSDAHEALDRASHYTEDSIKIVRIDKTNEPLGATVRNDGESVIIGRIVRGGAAEKSGLLHEGDEILEVNGIPMRGKSVNEVCDLLATMTGTLTFLIVPSGNCEPPREPTTTMVHVKAHFDYEPEDDLYIPCRELGIPFQKGDVLHVINQEDANWWQAYREGEEDQTLAGLIPSKAFQQQLSLCRREAVKMSMLGGDGNNKEKSKKGKFLCAKKHHKKKKQQKQRLGSTASEEFDAEQVLTYEEVALYYPRANCKRPIVLIGPSNIGRHELRQKLMEDTQRFAAAVPHTSRPKKESEVDGVDYHFIGRPQFEADILSGKFVEHGEYERNYYGTSIEAIRAVVSSGKTCVLNLHPQSLKTLKYSDLKPYVVFVAPPSLEKLRQNRARMGVPVKEEELRETIERARQMEENYGHYFDMVIINSDIDKAYGELLREINILEREPQWVPSIWLKNDAS